MRGKASLSIRPVNTESLGDVAYLYAALARRLGEPETNISHKQLPTWEEHCEFIENKPYAGHYIVYDGKWPIGIAYCSHDYELGIWLTPEDRGKGIGSWTLKELMRLHPADYWYANVNPHNWPSRMLFERNGFKLNHEQPVPVQVTYTRMAFADA